MTPGGGRASLATVGGGLVAATARPVSSGFRCSTAATALALSSRALVLSFTAATALALSSMAGGGGALFVPSLFSAAFLIGRRLGLWGLGWDVLVVSNVAKEKR